MDSRIEPNDPFVKDCVAQLSQLLRHSDCAISQRALRCFRTLAERFHRAGANPEPLVQNGLLDELLRLLSSIANDGDGGAMAASDGLGGNVVVELLNLMWYAYFLFPYIQNLLIQCASNGSVSLCTLTLCCFCF